MKVVYDTDAYLKKHNKTVPLPSENTDNDAVKSADQSTGKAISEDRTERLLKLAETDPELAGKIADFMKTDIANSKPEREKIEITSEQKMYAKKLLKTEIWGTILFFLSLVLIFLEGSNGQGFPLVSVLIMISIAVTYTICAWKYAIKAGFPIFKSLASKYDLKQDF